MQGKKTPSDYIGCVTISKLPYYDIGTNTTKFKARPVLIIGVEKNSFPCDFIFVPISTITNKVHQHSKYDYELNQNLCHTMNLNNHPSYIRLHKQSTCHSKNVEQRVLYNLPIHQSDLYKEIKRLHQDFTKSLF